MQLFVSSASELPIYRQLMRQVADAIAGGRLAPGGKLPSQRELAERLVISPLTVKKAYDELEREGLIRTERGRGTFVTAGVSQIDPIQQRERLRDPVRQLLARAHLGGVRFAEIVSLLEEVRAELDSQRAERGEPHGD
jgi:GntR family transcriptional regulator